MKRSDLKELIKKSMLEVSPKSGAMTPEEEKMVADYEEEEANKYALDKEEPMEEALLAEDNLEVKSIAKQLYSWLKQNDINTKLVAQTPSTSYGKQIGASLKGGSNEALILYYDDPKTKQTVIQVQLYGGPTSKDLVLQIEKKLLSSYPKLEQYDRQEIPTPQFFNLNFKVKEKTTAKGGLAGNTRLKQEPMEEARVILNRDEVYAKYAPLVRQYRKNGLDKHAAILKAQDVLAKEYGATPLNIQSTISDYFDDQDGNSTYANENVLREADDIVAAYAEKKTIKEEMHGGYLELLEMNPDFEEGARLLLNAWFEWKEGPMTEPQMVEEAKQDILAYLSSMMK